MSRKNYEVPDHGLWDEIKRAIQPLSIRKQLKAKPKFLGLTLRPHPVLASPDAAVLQKSPRLHPPDIASFDRRTTQKLGRGQMEPEAKLDLHGENLESARMQLLHFVSLQRHRGLRFVLVITGKGQSQFARHTLHGHTHFHTPEREGKLRREVPLWFHETPFRTHVVGFQPAHPRHGGGGAFYVKLRKREGGL